MSQTEFDARFREIQVQFLERMIQDKIVITLQMAEWETVDAYKVPLQEFYKVIHRYSGNGRTFGFPYISKAAMPLDELLQSVQTVEQLRKHLPSIRSLCKALLESFARASKETTNLP